MAFFAASLASSVSSSCRSANAAYEPAGCQMPDMHETHSRTTLSPFPTTTKALKGWAKSRRTDPLHCKQNISSNRPPSCTNVEPSAIPRSSASRQTRWGACMKPSTLPQSPELHQRRLNILCQGNGTFRLQRNLGGVGARSVEPLRAESGRRGVGCLCCLATPLRLFI